MHLWFWTFSLLAAAFVLAVFECFIPSGGFLAILTLAALIASVACALSTQTFAGFVYFVVMLVGVPLLLRWLIAWFPRSPMGRRLMLQPENDPALKPSEQTLRLRRCIGRRGNVVSRMMPGGIVEVNGERLDAVSDSGPLEGGEEIVVVRVEGPRVVVRLLPDVPAKTNANSATTEQVPVIDDPFE
ncbi:MAG: NfeD family protein [Thermoguttaceae bacterium]